MADCSVHGNPQDASSAGLDELEARAHAFSREIDALLQSVRSSLQQMSSLTLDCVSVFADSVEQTCDSVDTNIKATYALMAKCEELSNSMSQLDPMEREIESIKRTLDRFEAAVRQSPKR